MLLKRSHSKKRLGWDSKRFPQALVVAAPYVTTAGRAKQKAKQFVPLPFPAGA
jgi:hypothetical protein